MLWRDSDGPTHVDVMHISKHPAQCLQVHLSPPAFVCPGQCLIQEPVPRRSYRPLIPLAHSIFLQHLSVVVILLAISSLYACMVLLVLDKFQVIIVIHLTSMILLGAEGTARKEKSARPGKGDPN